MKKCPHADIRFCPLYHAMHIPEAVGVSCDDGELHEQTCVVARGVSYREKIELLRVRCPGLVEQLEWKETAEASSAQRKRNMRLAGIH